MKTLKEAYKNYFKIGAAVNIPHYRSCKELITGQFDTLTCENEMKYSSVCSEKGEYDFTKADELYNFAKDNGLEMRGHNLVWHWNIYDELFESLSPEALWERLKEHIAVMAERYPGLSCWDVINEATDDKHEQFLRDTVWRRKFGDDYYLKIYALARELMPGIPLVYNDYNEFVPEKRKKIIRMANELKAQGLVDIIGLQGHITVVEDYSTDELKRAFEDYAKTGLRLHVTELDIALPSVNTERSYKEATAEEIERHAELYGDIFAVYREYSELIDSVTFWGVADDQSWFNYTFGNKERNALLFGRDHKPNEAFLRVIEF